MEELLLEAKKYIVMGVSGAIGGLIAALNTKQRKGAVLILATLTGAFVAAFGVPLVTEYFNIQNEELRLGIAFFLGAMSTPIIQKLATNPEQFWKSKK